MLPILALLPILVVAVFLVGLRWPAAYAMPLAFVTTVLLALLVWQVPTAQVAAATVKGGITAIGLLYIIFGAILLLNVMKESGGLAVVRPALWASRRIAASRSSSWRGSSDRSSKVPQVLEHRPPWPFRS